MKFIIIISNNFDVSTIYYIFYNIYLFYKLHFDKFKETSKGGDMISTWNYEEMEEEANSYSEIEMSSLYDSDDENDWTWYF